MIKPIPKNADGLNSSRLTYGITYVFIKRQNKRHCFVLEDGKLIKIFTSPENEIPEGSIIVGRVSELVPSIHCAFVSVSKTDKCFIKESDLLPEFNLSRPGQEIKCGDLILVKVTKLPSKGKKATVSTCIAKDIEERNSLIENARHLTQYSYIKKVVPKYIEPVIDKPDNCCLITDDIVIQKEIEEHLGISIDLYSDKMVSLSALLGLESKLSLCLEKRVWLKSGAYIYIEPTEAMTVIDVNSGKNTKKNTDLFFDVNVEAIYTVIDQIILRNISGIIMVDCINMSDKVKISQLLERAKEYAGQKDELITIVDMTSLGIMEITRRKSGNTIYEQIYG